MWKLALNIRHLVAAAAGALLTTAASNASAWEMVHANSSNTGFVNVTTQPATAGSVSVPNIGTFTWGVGPVIGKDGAVYIGNRQGRMMAFRADGTPYWSQALGGGEQILASAAIDPQGKVYVVGSAPDGGTLHIFSPTGEVIDRLPMPRHGAGSKFTIPPTIVTAGDSSAVFIPYTFTMESAPVHFIRLAVYSGRGGLLDIEVDSYVPETMTGGASIDGPLDRAPEPMIAIYRNGLEPRVLVVHGNDVIGLKSVGSSLTREFDTYISDQYRPLLTTPVILPNNVALLGRAEGLFGVGLQNGSWHGHVNDALAFDAPTLLPNGTVVAIRKTAMNFVKDFQLVKRTSNLPGESYVSAAASQTHFFVSSKDAFGTYDVNTLLRVAKFDWVGGGLNPPAIGPMGHVYGIASNTLFIFPPPKTPENAILLGQPIVELPAGSASQVAPQPTSTLPPTQRYAPPLTANGNRLFACEELDGDDCGKGDYRAISLAWCQKQGFAKAADYNVDNRKVKAETLDGQFCSKNKCKVFDSIDCAM